MGSARAWGLSSLVFAETQGRGRYILSSPFAGCLCFWSQCPNVSGGRRKNSLSQGLISPGFPLRQLVNAGVLTVRDAGSWWLAVPGAGRFIKYFVKGILSAA